MLGAFGNDELLGFECNCSEAESGVLGCVRVRVGDVIVVFVVRCGVCSVA